MLQKGAACWVGRCCCCCCCELLLPPVIQQQQPQRLLRVGVPKGTMLRVGSGSQAVAAAAAAATVAGAAEDARGRGRGRGPNARHATGSCPEALVVGTVSEAAPVRPIASIVRRYAKLGAVKVCGTERDVR